MVPRSSAVLVATLVFCTSALAQAAPAPDVQTPATPPPGATVLQIGTQIVVLDVVVQDKNGKPVHGLKASNFQLIENKTPEQLRHVEEHTPPPVTAHGPSLGPMPPGTFTDYTPVPPGSTLNVLLLDALNTPTMYQTWVRDQLRKYVKTAPPGQRLAIFGLTDHLIMLQGFTSDPEVLKTIIENKLDAKVSPLLSDQAGTNTQDMSQMPGISDSPVAANLREFETQQNAIETNIRIKTTYDAFNALSRYLSGFPGRKNILWFSGSFPSGVLPVGESPAVLDITSTSSEMAETTAALASAQVAIYPIDARGLMTSPIFNPANDSPSLTASNSRGVMNDMQAFSTSQAEEHATMQNLAEATGGKAFYNTNGITQAITEALSSGSDYYTLSYTPTDRDWNGKFRSFHVKLIDAPTDDKLTYRPGYFATKPRAPRKVEASTLNGPDIANPANVDQVTRYDRTILTRGAPTPQDILFKVRVLPAKADVSDTILPNNFLSPTNPAKGPFRRYDADFILQPSEITFTPEPNGTHASQIKFTIYVYDRDGKLLVSAHRGFNLNLKPDFYEKFIKGAVQCHMEVSVPDRNETFLRIAVEDIATDRFGVVEFPTAAVRHLPPPVYGPAPAKQP
jgi:VWFA-related protein